jgi:hypothetical protein
MRTVFVPRLRLLLVLAACLLIVSSNAAVASDAALGGQAIGPPPPGCLAEGQTPEPPTAQGVRFGAWVGADVNVAGDEQAFERALGRPRTIRHWFWSAAPINVDAASFRSWSASMGRDEILMLSWAPSPFDSALERVNAGEHDEYIVSWARALRDYGGEVWLRQMWEDNGTWYWWRSRAASDESRKDVYVGAFRHVVDLFRRERADNVRFIWSPAVRGDGEAPPILTYAGAEYVDWVGLDVYPQGSPSNDFRTHFEQDYDELAALGKPLMIAETGLDFEQDAERARYVANLLTCELPYHFPKIAALVWFSQPGWGDLLDPAYPLTREAFRAGINQPYYGGEAATPGR